MAEWLYTHGVEKPVLTIDTNSGVKRITRQGAQLWQVEMGAYSTLPADLPAIHMGEGPLVDQPLTVEGKVWKVTCISVGNPHCVTVVERSSITPTSRSASTPNSCRWWMPPT